VFCPTGLLGLLDRIFSARAAPQRQAEAATLAAVEPASEMAR
jgi:hypothetical protein